MVQPAQTDSWLSLISSSGDASLGAALVRLAKLAASLHEAEMESADPVGSDDLLDHAGEEGSNGLGLEPLAPSSADGAVRKEVDR